MAKPHESQRNEPAPARVPALKASIGFLSSAKGVVDGNESNCQGVTCRDLRALLAVIAQAGDSANGKCRRCPISPPCSCAAASARPHRLRPPLRRLPPHPARRRAHARARLRAQALRALLRHAPEERRLGVRSERVHASERPLAVAPQGRLSQTAGPRGPDPAEGRLAVRCARRAPGHRLHRSSRLPASSVFDFVSDLAARPAYTDHYMRDYRLARVNPVGVGAAARFQLKAPLAKQYAELPHQRRSTARGGSSRRCAWGGAGATARWPSTTSRRESAT